ncbi:MAG: HNH endonuclease, partial [Actinomycetota bacterium]
KLACDAKVSWVATDRRGLVASGRDKRGIPHDLVAYLKDRDQGCRFGGCSRTRHLNAHHIVHWANGGPTNVDNMVMLCHQHHGLIHEGGWRIEGSPEPGPGVGDTLAFVRPDGAVFVPHPMVAAWRSGLPDSGRPGGGLPPDEGPPPDGDPPPDAGRGWPESLF